MSRSEGRAVLPSEVPMDGEAEGPSRLEADGPALPAPPGSLPRDLSVPSERGGSVLRDRTAPKSVPSSAERGDAATGGQVADDRAERRSTGPRPGNPGGFCELWDPACPLWRSTRAKANARQLRGQPRPRDNGEDQHYALSTTSRTASKARAGRWRPARLFAIIIPTTVKKQWKVSRPSLNRDAPWLVQTTGVSIAFPPRSFA